MESLLMRDSSTIQDLCLGMFRKFPSSQANGMIARSRQKHRTPWPRPSLRRPPPPKKKDLLIIPVAVASRSQAALGRGRGRVVRVPVPSDVLSPADPDLLPLALKVVQEPGQSRRPPGAADQPAVQPDRHHLGGPVSTLLHNTK